MVLPSYNGSLRSARRIAHPICDTLAYPNEWRLWQLPYALIHRHAWTDAVLGAAGMVFAGLSMLLALLIGGLFGLIGIELLEKVFVAGDCEIICHLFSPRFAKQRSDDIFGRRR